MSDDRSAYLTTTEELEDLEVALAGPDGASVPGRIISLNFFGASISYARKEMPPIPIGLEQTITFSSPQLKRSIDVMVRAMSRMDEGDIYRYDFSYVNQDELKSQLPAALFRLFNQRKTFRVEPDEKAPIKARVTACRSDAGEASAEEIFEGEIVATIQDISSTGIALLVDQQGEVALAAASLVEVTFTLPTHPRPIRLEARIRHRRIVQNMIRVGLEFVDGEQESIIEYVMLRQREELKQTV